MQITVTVSATFDPATVKQGELISAVSRALATSEIEAPNPANHVHAAPVADAPTAPPAPPVDAAPPAPPAAAAPSAPPAPPAPPAVEPPAPPAAPAAPAPNVELDKDGIPWDERIHAKNKAKIANGTWRKAKGIDPAIYDAVVAELKGGQPSAPSAPPAPPAPPAAPAASAPPAPPVATESEAATLITQLSDAMLGGQITMPEMSQVLAQHGVSNVLECKDRPDVLREVVAFFRTMGKM